MRLAHLVLVNLGRNKRRTFLTMASVTVALFLFCALGGVLDTLQESIKVGSLDRLIARNRISLIFPLPYAYKDRIAAVSGVRRVAGYNWFGGLDPKDPRNFFAQFAVEEDFFRVYDDAFRFVAASPPQVASSVPEGLYPELAAYRQERTACVVGKKLMEKMGWKLGQTVTLSGTIYPGDWPFTIRGVFEAKDKTWNDETMFFRFDYLDQKGMGGQRLVGVYLLELERPDEAPAIAQRIDALFENSAAATRTESEQAFQAGFVSMYGNVPFVLRVIGLAVVFAILLVAANTMVMSIRERTSEIGVLKTLGFSDGTILGLVLGEAAVITLGGGIAGALLAKLLIETSGFNFGGFLPPMSVYWSTVAAGIAIATVMGAVSGLIPALRASRLRIVDALRRVD